MRNHLNTNVNRLFKFTLYFKNDLNLPKFYTNGNKLCKSFTVSTVPTCNLHVAQLITKEME